MTDRITFESRLEARLLAHAEFADRSFEAAAISASAAAAAARRRRWTFPDLWRADRRGSQRPALALALAIIMALLVGTMALVGARLLMHEAPLGRPLAVAYPDRLELVKADGSSPRVIRDDGPFFDPRWSRDGAYLAVRGAPVGSGGTVYILRSDGSEVGRLTTALSVRWSPYDDRLLAASAGERGLVMLQTDGSVIETFGIGSGPGVLDAFAWADAETVLWHFAGDRVVGRLTREGGANIFLPSPFADAAPSFMFLADTASRNGTKFLAWGDCASDATACQGIALFDVDGPAGSVLLDDVDLPACEADPISPDGSALLFERTVDGVRSIFRAAADGSAQLQLTSGPSDDRCPRWSADGRRILFLRSAPSGSDVWTMDAAGADLIRVARGANGAELQSIADPRPTDSPPPVAVDGFLQTGSMAVARAGAAAVRLADGRVLVVGGWGSRDDHDGLTSAEIYDPATGSFTPTGSMREGRVSPSVTLLTDGRVLVAGGYPFHSMTVGPATPLSSAELYDPATGTFSSTGQMIEGRAGHAAVRIPSGDVLIAGGDGGIKSTGATSFEGITPGSIERFDPATGSFAVDSDSKMAGAGDPMVLADGSVLFVSSRLVLYAPGKGVIWERPASGLDIHGSTPLEDERVLIVGSRVDDPRLSVQVFDPVAQTFGPVVPLAGDSVLSPDAFFTAIRSTIGRVIVMGYSESGEPITVATYDPETGDLAQIVPMAGAPTGVGFTTTALRDGAILFAGGTVIGVGGAVPIGAEAPIDTASLWVAASPAP